jgi:hypothetical protein
MRAAARMGARIEAALRGYCDNVMVELQIA